MIQGVGIASFGGGGSSAASNTDLVNTVTTNISSGNNTIAHSTAGTISGITVRDSSNRDVEFADMYWDGTNIYVNSSTVLSNITFTIHYTA